MLASYESRASVGESSDEGFWGNMKIYSSPTTKTLHDPECRDLQCEPTALLRNLQVQSNWDQMFKNSPSRRVGSTMSVEINNSKQLFYNFTTTCNGLTSPTQYRNSCRYISNHCRNSQAFHNRQLEWNKRISERRGQKHYCKGVEKRKRKRTAFTTEQIIALEEVFKKRPYISLEERRFLTDKLNVNEKAIKVWFQNRRRLTEKREREQSDSYNSDSTIEDVSFSTNSARLAYIESHVYQTTDEKGFVTLDDTAMSELVNVIDNVLSPNIDWHRSLYDENENVKLNESYLMYEPISPVSMSDKKESEAFLEWQPSVPEESLQRLLDIQSALLTQKL